MLVLKRNVGTSIIIDGDIKVYILWVERNQIKIGIEAPKEVKIMRTELLEKKS